MDSFGYLVVLKEPHDIASGANARYKGLYRKPPFLQDEWNRGFEDPYMKPTLTNDAGFFRDIETAEWALSQFVPIFGDQSLEIIYAEDVERKAAYSADKPNKVLGYDIACEAPFWSILADPPLSPDIDDAQLMEMLDRLNAHGLLDDSRDAANYRRRYYEQWQGDPDVRLYVWEVMRTAE
jgi:hypothetical protein